MKKVKLKEDVYLTQEGLMTFKQINDPGGERVYLDGGMLREDGTIEPYAKKGSIGELDEGEVFFVDGGEMSYESELFEDHIELSPVEARYQKMREEFGRDPQPGFHLTRNLLSKRVIEVKDGTPSYMDPSCESYHCM